MRLTAAWMRFRGDDPPSAGRAQGELRDRSYRTGRSEPVRRVEVYQPRETASLLQSPPRVPRP
jgi:hypothetical protein